MKMKQGITVEQVDSQQIREYPGGGGESKL